MFLALGMLFIGRREKIFFTSFSPEGRSKGHIEALWFVFWGVIWEDSGDFCNECVLCLEILVSGGL